MTRAVAFATVIAGLCLSAQALAHHSFAAFDQSRTLTLKGTVKDWQWTNPHTWLVLEVPDPSGSTQEWNIEGQSPQVLRREQGFSRDIVKPGDKVIVTIHPRRDGSNGGSFIGVTAADGHALVKPAPAAP